MEDVTFHKAHGGDAHPDPENCNVCAAFVSREAHGGSDFPDPTVCIICHQEWRRQREQEEAAFEEMANTLNEVMDGSMPENVLEINTNPTFSTENSQLIKEEEEEEENAKGNNSEGGEGESGEGARSTVNPSTEESISEE